MNEPDKKYKLSTIKNMRQPNVLPKLSFITNQI